MLIPIANAIFDGDLQIEKLLKIKKKTKKIENFTFKTVNSKIFPTVKLIKEINKYPSAPIIVNAANEILVDQFLRENIDFLSIYRTIKTILNDRNYRKYAIKTSKSIDQIINIDNWTRKLTFKIIKKTMYKKIVILSVFFLNFIFLNLHSEIIKDVKVSGNKRISEETIKVYGNIKIGEDYNESNLNSILQDLYKTNFFENINV